MASIGDLYFTFRGDGARLTADAKKEGAAAGDVAGKGFVTKMKATLKGGLGGGLAQGLGIGAALGGVGLLTSATSMLVDEIGNSIEAASDQREAMSLGAQVFEENSKQIEEWAATMAEGAGLATTEAINFAAGFGNAFKNVGFTLDETADKSKVMTELAADLGSAFNATGEEAATALRSGLLGESEPLRRFGVFLSDAAVKAEALSSGIAEQGDVLTDNQKVLARYNIIMRQTADSQGMFGRDTESLADTQKQLSATFENIRAEVGTALLPVMVELGQALRDDILPAITDVSAAVKDDIGPAFEFLKTTTELATFPIRTLVDIWSNVIGAVGGAVDAVTGAADTIPRDSQVIADAMAARAGEIDRSHTVVQDAYKATGIQSSTTRRGVVSDAGRMATAINIYRDAVIDAARGLVSTAYQIISDKAELTAINIEKAELRKVIATGKATKEQKDHFTDLTHRQEELVLDLAENGEEGSDAVKDAMKDIKRELTEGNYLEKRAANATVTALNKVKAAADRARASLVKYNSTALISSTYSGPKSGGKGQRAAGGPVVKSTPYWVGEEGPELMIPQTNGVIIDAAKSAAMVAGASGGPSALGDTHVHLQTYGLPMRARTPVEVGHEVRRAIRHGRPTAVPKTAKWDLHRKPGTF